MSSTVKDNMTVAQLFGFLLLFGFVMIIAGAAISYGFGKHYGYEAGLKDGMQSTLLIDVDYECKALKWEDAQ